MKTAEKVVLVRGKVKPKGKRSTCKTVGKAETKAK